MRERKLPAVLCILLCLVVASAQAVEESLDETIGTDTSDDLELDSEDDYDLLFDEDDPFFDDDFDDTDLQIKESMDPLEEMNRQIFAFNEILDEWAFDPVTRGYQFVVPEPGRRGVRNFFLNLESPVLLLNQILQLRPAAAAVTLGRFALNTTAGGLGLMDPAGHGAGWHRIEADFGQTLARWGTPSGPYLVLPVLGPSTLRDLGGDIVDRMMDPLTYFVGPLQWWIPLAASQGLATREANVEALEALEASSIDFYAALRSAYLQSREADVREALPPEEPSALVEAPVLEGS
jgi:phospholipid-binding lipoprotein MlaA